MRRAGAKAELDKEHLDWKPQVQCGRGQEGAGPTLIDEVPAPPSLGSSV